MVLNQSVIFLNVFLADKFPTSSARYLAVGKRLQSGKGGQDSGVIPYVLLVSKLHHDLRYLFNQFCHDIGSANATKTF